MIHPLPVEAIRRFAATVDRLFVVEELEAYLEEQILAAGIPVEGKRWFPSWSELTPVRVGRGFVAAGLDLPRWASEKAAEDDGVIPRPPVLCTGCPHRGMAMAMKKLDLDVHGDIGCYDLTTLPPVSHMHSAFEMGASIPIEQGFTRAGGSAKGSIAVIGDSTFLHSGLTGLLNAVHQGTNVTVLIQNNDITAMTGGQTHPGTAKTLAGAETKPVDLGAICRALGVEHVETVDPYDYEACLDGAEGRPRLRRTGRHHHQPALHALPAQGARRRRVRGRRGPLHRLPAVHEAGLPVAAAHRGDGEEAPQGDHRRRDLHRLLAVRAALQAGRDREGGSSVTPGLTETRNEADGNDDLRPDMSRGHYADGVVDDVMVVGVGGQGVIVAAAIIADTAMLHGGLEVKTSETRGMSQRGGSVTSHIRIGETVIAPSISPGEIDYLLAFESAEGLRLAPSLAPGGLAIVNTQQIVPPLASTGTHEYPFDAVQRMLDRRLRTIAVNGSAVAEKIGDARVAGVVLVGALSAHLPFANETWEHAIARNVPASWLELNLAAFAAGNRLGAAGVGGAAGAGAAAEADPSTRAAKGKQGGVRQ